MQRLAGLLVVGLRCSARSLSRDLALRVYCLATMRTLTRDDTLIVMQQTLSLVNERFLAQRVS